MAALTTGKGQCPCQESNRAWAYQIIIEEGREMRLFKLPLTQKYDMYHLLGDDNILILKNSNIENINTLRNSMNRNSITTFKDLPLKAKTGCIFYNDTTDYTQTIPVEDKQIQVWLDNGYLVKEVKK